MKILGLESSCDETAAAIVDVQQSGENAILANRVYSQTEEHLDYGGVVPEIASRAHMDRMNNIINQSLKDADLTLNDIDAVAATAGPGLLGGLLVGVMTAKSIAHVKNIPFIATNHLEGHALTARLSEEISFPYLLLLVSGGHCQYIQVETLGRYHVVGSTLDDAVGECFDKIAKMMGLPYPGGPAIEQYATKGDPQAFTFPLPMKDKGVDFSFSGLKSAVRRVILENEPLTLETKQNIAASFQRTVAELLVHKSKRAISETAATRFVLAGGVAANRLLRSQLEEMCAAQNVAFFTPPIHLCTDNAVMIAYAAGLRFIEGESSPLNSPTKPRWPLADLTPPA